MDNPKPGKLCSTAMVVGQANNRFFFPSPYSVMGENLSKYILTWDFTSAIGCAVFI